MDAIKYWCFIFIIFVITSQYYVCEHVSKYKDRLDKISDRLVVLETIVQEGKR